MIRVLNRLDPDQDRHFVGPDMGQTVCKDQQTTLADEELACCCSIYLLFYIFNDSAIFCFLVPHVKMQ